MFWQCWPGATERAWDEASRSDQFNDGVGGAAVCARLPEPDLLFRITEHLTRSGKAQCGNVLHSKYNPSGPCTADDLGTGLYHRRNRFAFPEQLGLLVVAVSRGVRALRSDSWLVHYESVRD